MLSILNLTTSNVLFCLVARKVKSMVFYGQESPRGEYNTAACRVNSQLLAVMLQKQPNWHATTTS